MTDRKPIHGIRIIHEPHVSRVQIHHGRRWSGSGKPKADYEITVWPPGEFGATRPAEVNWPGIGNVPPDDAAEFARAINIAAELAKAFDEGAQPEFLGELITPGSINNGLRRVPDPATA